MEKRKLGKTNMYVNPVGFGGIPIQRITKEEAKEVINHALDLGCNFIDSAKGYTCSEAFIGEAIKERRNDVFLATKSMAKTYEAMEKDIKDSLEKFQTDHIDLYQMHNVKSMEIFKGMIDEAFKALIDYKAKGIVRHIGITSHSLDFINELLDTEYMDIIETIQIPYNFIEPEAEPIYEKANKLDIGTIAMKPLGGGAIDDGRIAIKFLLNNKNLSVAIPGMASIEEVEANLGVNDLTYTDSEINYMKKLKDSLKGEFCHRCGYCMPCTKGIDIPGTMTLERYCINYNLKDWAIKRYFSSVLASNCIDCKVCVSRCPYNLDIPTKMKKIAKLFEKE